MKNKSFVTGVNFITSQKISTFMGFLILTATVGASAQQVRGGSGSLEELRKVENSPIQSAGGGEAQYQFSDKAKYKLTLMQKLAKDESIELPACLSEIQSPSQIGLSSIEEYGDFENLKFNFEWEALDLYRQLSLLPADKQNSETETLKKVLKEKIPLTCILPLTASMKEKRNSASGNGNSEIHLITLSQDNKIWIDPKMGLQFDYPSEYQHRRLVIHSFLALSDEKQEPESTYRITSKVMEQVHFELKQ